MQITDGNSIGIEVWTDETGKILSHENAPTDVALYFCNGEKTETITLCSLALRGKGDDVLREVMLHLLARNPNIKLGYK